MVEMQLDKDIQICQGIVFDGRSDGNRALSFQNAEYTDLILRHPILRCYHLKSK